jgi:hypothetical protein
VLALSVGSLTFSAVRGGAAPAEQTVQITNQGGGSLSGMTIGPAVYGAGQPTGWLTRPGPGAAPTSGTVTFAVGQGTLGAGIYTASVELGSANGGSETVAVTLQVQAPVLTLSSRSVSLSATQGEGNPAPQTVTVSNTGVGTQASLGTISLGAIAYASGEPAGWFAASLHGGGAAITLSAVTGSLPSGTFTARVPVVSQFGGTETVTVSFTVAPGAAPPVLALSATEVSFNAILGGENPAPQSIAISNQGGQTLGTLSIGAASPDAPWLAARLQGAEGGGGGGGGGRAVFTASTVGLAAGSHVAVVPIRSANAGSLDARVTLVVGAPRIALSSRAVTFGDTVGSERRLRADVFVSNSGAGDLAALGVLSVGAIGYGAGEPSGWLLQPAAGQVLGSPVVRLEAVVGGLPSGSYSARVPVLSGGGGSEVVTVQVVVNRPDPALDQPSIEFAEGDRAVASVQVSRAAGDTAQFAIRVKVRNPTNTAIALTGLRVGTTEYRIGAAGWIAGAFLDKTSAPFGSPAELLVAVAPRGLAAGRYEADVPISSSVAKNSPRKLRVIVVMQ